MTTVLAAKLEPGTARPVLGESFCVRMTIINDTEETVEVANPEVGVPPLGLDWQASNHAYQIALLMSLGLVRILLKDADGQLVESKGLIPWVTPVLGLREVPSHDKLALDFDLNELFLIDSAGRYSVWVRYGDNNVYAEASMDSEVMPRATASRI